MKSLGFILSHLTSQPRRRRNLRVVMWLVAVLVVMVAVYSTVFHVLMGREHHHYSWTTGVYWTLTTMSTLGFGDITFRSDAGRAFSALVLLTGALFILVLLPFAFIQFVFTPWMESREASRAPKKLPAGTTGHIVLAALGPIEDALIRRAKRMGRPYVVLVPSVEEALALNDRGYDVLVGELDDPETYRAALVADAALVASTLPDTTNANIAFTVREIDGDVPVVVTASSAPAASVLRVAGASGVIELGQMLGTAMARRVLGDAGSHVVGAIDDLVIAEASMANTPLVGRTLGELAVRERCGVNVVGVLERGVFRAGEPDVPVTARSVLVMAGNAEVFARYDARYGTPRVVEAPVVIVGAGRVGIAAGEVLGAAGIEHTVIERLPEPVPATAATDGRRVVGDAAELDVLERAGLRSAAALLVTTHDDDMNAYLTLYVRKLRPEIQIISRANHDRNVSTLHRAGADAVLSYASLGATEIWNEISDDDSLVLAEGIDVFRAPVPAWVAGRSLAASGFRQATGCNVIGLVQNGSGQVGPAPGPDEVVPGAASLVLVGDAEAEERFYTHGA